MGLLSNKISRESLKAGDHIYSWRTAYVYAHHGIYVGDNKVIHFTRGGRAEEVGTGTALDFLLLSSGPARSQIPCPDCNQQEDGNGVVSSCLNCFLSGGVLYRFEYAVNPALFLAKARGGTCTLAASDPDEIVVHRATHLLNHGFGCYSVSKKNCEDFAIYCKTGLLVLDQGRLGQSGQAVSYIGAPLSVVLSSPLRFLTTNIYGMAATTVGVYCAGRYAADIGMRSDVMKVEAEELLGLERGTLLVVEDGSTATFGNESKTDFTFPKIIFDQKIMSGFEKIISESQKIMSYFEKIISKSQKIMSNFENNISESQKIMSNFEKISKNKTQFFFALLLESQILTLKK